MFFLEKNTKTRFIFFLLVDLISIALAVFLAFLIRFDGKIPQEYVVFIPRMIALTVIFVIPVFYFQKLYSFSWTYVSTNELISLFKATTVSFLFVGIAIYISKYFPFFVNFPRSTLFISYFLIFFFAGAVRFSKRIYLTLFNKNNYQYKEKTLIVGAGDAGEQIARSAMSSKNSPYLLMGFADDNQSKQGLIIHGLNVLGKINDIPEIVRRGQIKQMIIALPSAGSGAIKKAVEMGRNAQLRKIKIVPSLGEIIDGQVSVKDLREIQVEDLLGRKAICLDTKAVEKFIENKIVLITGAAGSIGSELARQTARFGPSLLLILDQDETGIFNISEELEDSFPNLKTISLIADIRDKEKTEEIFRKFKPNIVFHAAAYKHVPLMEKQPDEAVKNNIFGTEIVARTALKNGVEKFIFISTDKSVNPVSIMGATKRIGEMICQMLNQKNHTKFISVRFGNVLDSRGSVIPIFREQIKKGGPVEVTHPDMKRYFMLTAEACLLVMQAGVMSRGGEVFVLDMGEPIKILDLAKEMIKLFGFEPDKDIPIVFTKVRPGEKIFEEILTAEEGTIVTQNQKIFMARLSKVNEQTLNEELEKLKGFVRQNNQEEIINILKKIAPSHNK